MKKSDIRHLENWPKTREKGRMRYAFSMTIIVLILLLIGKIIDYYSFNLLGTKNLLVTLLVSGMGWLIVGFLMYYFWLWNLEEKRFTDLVKKQNKEPEIG